MGEDGERIFGSMASVRKALSAWNHDALLVFLAGLDTRFSRAVWVGAVNGPSRMRRGKRPVQQRRHNS